MGELPALPARRNRGKSMTSVRVACAVLVAAIALAGCATDPYAPNQSTGAVAGALTGGALGALLGGRGAGSRIAGAAIGATAGGLIGSAIGAAAGTGGAYATGKREVSFSAERRLTFRLMQPMNING